MFRLILLMIIVHIYCYEFCAAKIEKEIISNAMDDGLNEEQMINIFLAPTDDMDNLRRAYVIDNKRNGDDR